MENHNREKILITSLIILFIFVGGIGVIYTFFHIAIPAYLGDENQTRVFQSLALEILILIAVVTIIMQGIIQGFRKGHKYLVLTLIITQLFTVYYKFINESQPAFEFDRKENNLEKYFSPEPAILYLKDTDKELFRIYTDIERITNYHLGVLYSYSANLQHAFAYQSSTRYGFTGSMALLSMEEYRKCIPQNDFMSPLWDIYNVKYFYINYVLDKKAKEKLVPLKIASTPQSEKDKLFSEAILSLFSDNKTKNKYKFNLHNIGIVDGFIGKGAFFNGKDSYISTNLDLRKFGSFTLSLWVRMEAVEKDILQSVFDNGHDENNDFALQIFDGNGGFSMHCFGEDSIGKLSVKEWTHVLFVSDLKERYFSTYINGVKGKTVSISNELKFGGMPLTFGKLTMSNERYFKGTLDEIVIWDRALDEKEIEIIVKGISFSEGIYVNKDVLPRAYVVTDYKVMKTKEEMLESLKSRANWKEIRKRVYLYEEPQRVRIKNADLFGDSRVSVNQYSPHKISLTADMKTDGFLILGDPWAPQWKAYVNGRETKILRAYHALRAIELNSGENNIEFVYDKNYIYNLLGRIITIFTLSGIFVVLGVRHFNRIRNLVLTFKFLRRRKISKG